MVKNPPTMQEPQEMQVQSLGWEDPLEVGKATHPSILAWRIPWTEEPGGLQSMWSQRIGHDWSNLAQTHRQKTNKNKSDTYNTNLFTLNLPPPPAPPRKTSRTTGLYSLFPIHHLHSTELPLPRSATPLMVPNLISISTSSLYLAILTGFASWPLIF